MARADSISLWAQLRRPYPPLTSLVLTVPVFVLYHLGVLFIDRRNGVDLVSGFTFRLLAHGVEAYVAVTLGFAFALLGVGWWMRGRGRVRALSFGPVVLESALWALVMLVTVGWATREVFSAQVGLPPMGSFEKLVMAAGAGFHEELVFRVGLFGGGALALHRWMGLSPWLSLVAAAVLAAALFSGVHYLGPLGDRFSPVSFVFRFFAGLFLTGLYRFRGFAVAVYSHCLYDLLVFFVF